MDTRLFDDLYRNFLIDVSIRIIRKQIFQYHENITI